MKLLNRGKGLVALAGLILTSCSDDPVSWRCKVTGPEVRDVNDARAACERARTVFAELLGRAAPPINVELGDAWGASRPRRWRREPELRMPTLKAYDEGRGPESNPDRRRAEWQDFIGHEVMHVLLARLPDALPGAREYGTAFPDWFDEALAIAAESQPVRARRLAQAREAIDRLPRVDSLVTSKHPSQIHRWERGVERITVYIRACPKPCPDPNHRSDTITVKQTRVDGKLQFDTVYGPSQYAAAANNQFYIASYALLEFLRRSLGDESIAGIAGLYRDESLRNTLPLQNTRLGSDPVAIDRAWREWLRGSEKD
jgi:hypothetical protein